MHRRRGIDPLSILPCIYNRVEPRMLWNPVVALCRLSLRNRLLNHMSRNAFLHVPLFLLSCFNRPYQANGRIRGLIPFIDLN